MRMTIGIAAGMLAAAAVGAPAGAEVRLERGQLAFVANGGVLLSGALVDDPLRRGGFTDKDNVDGYGSASLDWTMDSGVVVGAFVSRDSADNRPDTLKNDRLYGYVASRWGRFEVGRTSGPARRMSFYAPVLGSGQIRGDFARYAGISALLWPYDSRQAFKIAYLSPPVGGVRFGASWAPRVTRFATVQRDVFELGTQYEALAGRWVLGASASYVHGRAETPGLHGIRSWSLGLQARRDKLVIGGGYVDRGDSNRFTPGFHQREINLGVAWRTDRWSAALSAARTRANGLDNDLLGLGGLLAIGSHVSLTADVVAIRQRDRATGSRSGVVLVSGIDLHI